MDWVDVAGPPGSGKSTVCDPLWGPHDFPIEDRLPPHQWHDFINEITRLILLIHRSSTIDAVVRMNNRSMRKMSSVARYNGVNHVGPYIQTGFVQRGLGFGWRMAEMGMDISELSHYFRLMPVSIGVAFMTCPVNVVVERNNARMKVPETAHENRAHMVGLMQPAIELAEAILHERQVPIVSINTLGSVNASRNELARFASAEPCDATAYGPSSESPVHQTPPWWR